MKVLILYGEPVMESHWLYKELKNVMSQKGITVEAYGPKIKISALRKYKKIGWPMIQFFQLGTALGGILHTKHEDIIISQDFGTGWLCSALAEILGQKRKILALNCLRRGNSGIKNRVENAVNRFAWRNDNFITTINREEEKKQIVVPPDKIGGGVRVHIRRYFFERSAAGFCQ